MIEIQKGKKLRGCSEILEITMSSNSELGAESTRESIACIRTQDGHWGLHTAVVGEVRIWWE